METSLFSFDLPEDLIAQEPVQNREEARLLVLDRSTGRTRDLRVGDIPDIIRPDTVIVLNDTRVRKARLFAESDAGRKVEVLLLAKRDSATYVASVGAETFDASIRLSLSDGRVTAATLDNRVEVLERTCSDSLLNVCGKPVRYEIRRRIEIE